MAAIQLLPEEVINQIAAGEVVERPASVVKELVENALDSGASQIFVTLADGGRDLITVLDNGCGMDGADAQLALRRHATSKLRDAAGLSCIDTLGFRGEALASIAAVSRFELATCADEDAGGTRLQVEGGGNPVTGKMAFPRGTRITVEQLFLNTPARRKFLRSATTEYQYIQTQFVQIALAHPGVHFRLVHNQRQSYDLTPCNSLSERAYQLFGEEFAEGMIPVSGQEGTLGYTGLLSSPSASRASKRWQYLYINQRPVKNAGLSHAVYHAYRTLLMKGRHPAFILMLTLDHGDVDVNVHPAKSEVRLRNPQGAHSILADRLHKGLMEASRRKAFAQPQSQSAYRVAAAGGHQSHGPTAQVEMHLAGGGPSGVVGEAISTGIQSSNLPFSLGEVAPTNNAQPYSLNPPPFHASPQYPLDSSEGLVTNPMDSEGFHFQPISSRIDQASTPEGKPVGEGRLNILGQLQTTYLLAQLGESLVIIDQHAAHERILFEQYRRAYYSGKLAQESYLVPLTLELSAQNALLLEQYLEPWNKMGFEIEPFGRSTFLVRAIPALLSGKDVERLILDVLDDLALFGKSGKIEEIINEILERVACHGAIRAGMTLSHPEMVALAAQLELLDINLYCPHGRPVWVEITLLELEKRFKRIV